MQKQVAFTIEENGCWICNSHRPDSHGYPSINFNGGRPRFHRFMYQSAYGSITSDDVIRHICDNRL